MNEIYRVLKPGGLFYASTPAFPSPEAFQDPTHVNIITDGTHEYFCGGNPDARIYGFTGQFVAIEAERIYPKYKIMCEPQMGKRGLYPVLSTKNKNKLTKKYLDFLQYADGTNSLEKISNLIKLDLKSVRKIYQILFKNFLIS